MGTLRWGAIRGFIKRNRTAVTTGLLRVLYDQNPARARASSYQGRAGRAFRLFHMQERRAKGNTARLAAVIRDQTRRRADTFSSA